jgi:ribose transport system ATP-binding protein
MNATGNTPAPTLRIEGLSKTFPGQVALSDVDLSVDSGEVHALLGQNGSGKSTLVKILAGFHGPDPGGQAWVESEPFTLGDARGAQAAGIRFIHQDLGLVDEASVVENMALGTGYLTGAGRHIRWRAERRKAKEALDAIGLDVDVRRPVGELDAADRTGVAIARALLDWERDGVKLLVLDEPTAALPGGDAERLFAIMRRLRDQGVAMLFVSHHIEEVLAVSDRVTVLRGGARVATEPIAGLDHDGLIELIVGRKVTVGSAKSSAGLSGEPILAVNDLAGERLAGVSFTVRPGEVVGIAGLRGSGREEIAGLIAGRIPRHGEVTVGGKLIASAEPREAIEAGVFLVPGDRHAQGVIETMTLRENLTVSDLDRYYKKGWLDGKAERAETLEWIDRLAVVTSGPNAEIMTLSGGNQQKVLIARGLRLSPRLLVLDDPTRGVDVGAKGEIHALIDGVTESGTGVVLASTDAEELVRLCHRVIVLRHGTVGAELADPTTLTDDHIERAQIAA